MLITVTSVHKMILVIEMPSSCEECPCCYLTEGCYSDICQVNRFGLEEGYEKGRPNWCPLKPMIEKKDRNKVVGDYLRGRCDGYNACIDQILGDKE